MDSEKLGRILKERIHELQTALEAAQAGIVNGYVVVTHLSAGECDIYPGRDCVQSVVIRPDGQLFTSKDEADQEAALWPDWCTPHTMRLTRSEHL